MEIEREVKVIPIDENHQKAIDEYIKEGWVLDPTVPPVAHYAVVRAKVPLTGDIIGALGKLTIDESKIGVHRAGDPPDKIEWAWPEMTSETKQ